MSDEPALFPIDVPFGERDEPLPPGAPLAARMRPLTLEEFVVPAPALPVAALDIRDAIRRQRFEERHHVLVEIRRIGPVAHEPA